MTEGMREYVLCIRNLTQHYLAYLKADGLDPNVRGFEMHKAKRDWEMLGALYRVFRRGQLLRKAIMDSQQFRGN